VRIARDAQTARELRHIDFLIILCFDTASAWSRGLLGPTSPRLTPLSIYSRCIAEQLGRAEIGLPLVGMEPLVWCFSDPGKAVIREAAWQGVEGHQKRHIAAKV
jgi:hypothetical protein